MSDQLDEGRVDLQLARMVHGTTKIQRALDLATPERRARLLAEGLFFRSQVFGYLELHVQIAMIDRAYLPGQGADAGFHGLAREACHTV